MKICSKVVTLFYDNDRPMLRIWLLDEQGIRAYQEGNRREADLEQGMLNQITALLSGFRQKGTISLFHSLAKDKPVTSAK